MIRDILYVASVGVGSAMVGWAIGVSHKCDICTEERYCSDCELISRYSKEAEEFDAEADTDGDISMHISHNYDHEIDILTPAEYDAQYAKYVSAVKEYNEGTETVTRPNVPQMDEYPTGDDDICVISYNEWCEADEDEFKKDTIVYYEDDQIVCDMHDSTIKEYQELVGENALELFGMMSHDPDVVYIRNKRMQVDFEFVREHSSYHQSVLGLTEEAEEMSDKAVQDALAYFQAKSFDEIDPEALAKYHEEREDE